MKYCIHSFYQPRAVELGLTNDDLLVLRWFVDFANTKKMKTFIMEDRIYYWVHYDTVLKDLPVLRISKQTLFRARFGNLCKARVLIRHQLKAGGTHSYYCYGINYDTLQYLQDSEADDKCKKIQPSVKKHTSEMYNPTPQKCKEIHTKDTNTNPNTINPSLVHSGQGESDSAFNGRTEEDLIAAGWRAFYKIYPRKEDKKKAERLSSIVQGSAKRANNHSRQKNHSRFTVRH